MKRTNIEEFKKMNFVTCECGYNNKKEFVERYGTCRRCEKVLDQRAKLQYEMFCRLKMWRK